MSDSHSIKYNAESSRGSVPTIRDFTMSGARVHLKVLDDNVYMLIVENSDHYIYVKLTARSKRGKIDAWVYEEFPAEAPTVVCDHFQSLHVGFGQRWCGKCGAFLYSLKEDWQLPTPPTVQDATVVSER